MKTVVVESQCAGASGGHVRIDGQEEFDTCLVELHPSFSLTLALSDYYLPVRNDFAGEKIASREAYENPLLLFFNNTEEVFYRHYEITFKMTTSYRSQRCIFHLNRIILTKLNIIFNLMQK